jgi:3-hydroxybutyryl-CoA dehydrogenase
MTSRQLSGVERVGVVGAGTIGAGVTQSLAEHGLYAVTCDPVPGALDGARKRVEDGVRLRALLSKGESPVPAAEIQARISWTTELADLSEADFVIECAPEDAARKLEIFSRLDEICADRAIFASATSAIPVTRLASATSRVDRVLGLHFMNPVPVKDTVEVIKAVHTSAATLQAALSLLSSLGKRGIVVDDAAGFVSNRVLMLTVNEAAFVVHEGTAGAEAIDEVFRRCLGHPMGPLETADLIGLDVVLDSLKVLYEHYLDPKFRPCPLLTQLVHAGHHGRKTGQGFRRYPTVRTLV